LKASTIVEELLKYKYYQFTGVPCSIVKPVINTVIDSKECKFIPATIEGEATTIAAGSYMAGVNSVVFLQNSGLGNIINPLTSLTQLYRIPLLFFITWRGEPGIKDAPQHHIMGEKTLKFIDLLELPFEVLDDSQKSLQSIIAKAVRTINEDRRSFIVVLKKGIVEPYELKTRTKYIKDVSFEKEELGERDENEVLPSREEAVEFISSTTRGYPVISSTGYTSREFYCAVDRESNFYMQGSMGFALSIALGLSLYYKEKVFCIDGDASCLMRPGGLFTSALFNRGNLVYILLDNSAHDSTGGQPTISSNVDFSKLAQAAGFERFIEIKDVREIPSAISIAISSRAFTFIYVKIRTGKGSKLGRPEMSPVEITDRFKNFIKKNV